MADKNASIAAIQTTWIGPVPPPATLECYQKIVPNAAERLFLYAENEQRNRHKSDQRDFDITEQDIKEHYKSVLIGQIMSFVIIILIVASATICAYLHETELGCAIAAIGFISFVSVFIGRNDRYKKVFQHNHSPSKR